MFIHYTVELTIDSNKNTLIGQIAIAIYNYIPHLYTSKALCTLHSRQEMFQKKQKSFCHF